MAVITNKQILTELRTLLRDMDFFTLYPSKNDLRNYLEEGVSDTDKIRAVLRDEIVQREIFPDWHANKDKLADPVQAYKDMKNNPNWPRTEEDE